VIAWPVGRCGLSNLSESAHPPVTDDVINLGVGKVVALAHLFAGEALEESKREAVAFKSNGTTERVRSSYHADVDTSRRKMETFRP